MIASRRKARKVGSWGDGKGWGEGSKRFRLYLRCASGWVKGKGERWDVCCGPYAVTLENCEPMACTCDIGMGRGGGGQVQL